MKNEYTIDLDELERLALDLKGWSNCNKHWPHNDNEGVEIVGAITEGEEYPLFEIDADTYGTDGESTKLAAFYAAANPAAVLELIELVRKADGEREAAKDREGPTVERLLDFQDEIDRIVALNTALLAALERIVTDLSDNDDEGLIEHTEQMMQARAAIAKATGE